jgi:ATP-dependent helicase HrpB
MLLDGGIAGDKRVVVLQPRRVAARTVATRVAWERGCRVGGEVGYQVRFDDRTGVGTRISYVTEGILLRWLQQEATLADIGVVLFDEFHERNLLSDVSLALVKRLQETHRPDLKLAVMSATLDAEPVADYLSTRNGQSGAPCPILVSEGQMFPVEVRYQVSHDERSVSDQAAEIVEDIVNTGEPGDVLVFMPGMAEINHTIGALRAVKTSERLALIPLHGDLPPDQQDLAFTPNPLRKIVVATNVAETSVTIDGVRHVVDSGLARVARYDAERGIGTLMLEPISRASADQRKGRAGRTAPGTCHRLWTESGHLDRPERNTPEIQRSDLAEVVLLLHSLGVRRAAQFEWLDKPDPQALERAEQLLTILGALRAVDEGQPSGAGTARPRSESSVSSAISDKAALETSSLQGKASNAAISPPGSDLTSVGRQMLRLPMHPRYSRMLVEAAKFNCVPAAALCAALVSGRDLLMRLSRDDSHVREARELFEASQVSDFYTLMRAYEFARGRGFNLDACRRYGIHAVTARQVEQTFDQIMALAQAQGLVAGGTELAPPPAKGEIDPLPRCILAGFVDQLCIRRDLGTLECDLSEGRHGTLMRESVVQQAQLFVAASIREVEARGTKPLTLLGLATAVEKDWVERTFPEQVNTSLEHLYDRTHKRVAAIKLTRFRDLVIHQEHAKEIEPEAAARCLAEAYRKEFFVLPLFNHDIKQFITRVNLAHAVMPELDIPALDERGIIASLTRAFKGLTLAKEAQATPLRDAFRAHLERGQEAWLDELAPLAISWHDGRKIKLLYPEAAVDDDDQPNSPELQINILHCFAVKEHPHIFEGKLPVKLWLCAPDGKRLEPTFNWPGFRSLTYPKLRVALQKKYPGPSWP